MRTVTALAAAALASMTPALAAACPYCASQGNSGSGQTIALGAFILLPFLVTGAILQFIKSEHAGLAAQNETSNQNGSRRIAE